jgi:cation:H+ antiporter
VHGFTVRLPPRGVVVRLGARPLLPWAYGEARGCRIALHVAFLLAGLAVLAKGSDVFVVAAARLAVTLRMSPVAVGAVVVGFGTGAPELLVSSIAAARGSLDIAAGNVVGSNLANLTLVLGVAGLIARLETVPRIIRLEAPLSLATVALFALLLQNGLSRWEGGVLLLALGTALVLMLRAAGEAAVDVRAPGEATALAEFVEEVEEFVEDASEPGLAAVAAARSAPDAVRVALGLVATVAGAQLLVVGAQRIADEVGLSGGVVGLTIVAVGTSLPELVTAIQSARRNETALLAGNVLGSNVFNSTAVGGVAALVGPGALTDAGLTVVAAGSMVGIAGLAWLFLGLGGRLRRWEGGVLLSVYAATLVLLR